MSNKNLEILNFISPTFLIEKQMIENKPQMIENNSVSII